MVRLEMELAWPFQCLVVVFLVVPSSIGTFDCVHLMIVVARSLASEIITVVATPVPTFSVVTVIVVAWISVIKTTTAIVSSGRLLGSSHVFADELFCVIGIGIIFGRGEEFSDRGRPFA